ncbi:alanine/glycine:cation symporter family protein [Ignatzschineria cameli]|uniref:Sodium:alanine symporter n=1 Tax=Ignatzschineria cameli TaxID=2182793 RepID=A0A2U2ARJ9_9GAMM|nr:alanine/glycine:cation symporter family protein [Ignatzschineria cameli]PWD86754.1 sodium:alanine symporter [Ignatzschineria cameli]PWD86892.1 sodium:alanine symporter [Ignatzschineria cameli]PWD91865.1 sodium:alanine symporter [Ignatzschineria cameli]PWD93548.1 sodium:alanine symporter [Ignatzschineria cameli]PWD94290.1 sodium:alanine symporter [Ignatzschineria cameli]
MQSIVDTLVGYIWGNALVALSLGAGLYFTIITRGVQFRYLIEMIKLLKEGKSSQEGISSFQAFCLALSSRVGVGNIAGVATAIAAGGPGAIFWMAVMGLLGGASAFAESTLSQIYKQKVDGQYRGGAPYYIERGLGWKPFAILMAVVICISYGFLVPGIQSNTIADSFNTAFNIPPVLTGIVITIAMAYLIFGGVKRIANYADKIIPIMALLYIILMFVILGANITQVPAMFKLIISSAFGMDAIFGGIVGLAVAWGVRRAVFSSMAGAGEATFSSAAAEVSHPVKQGLIQGFSIYIDTVIVCVATGLMILITGMYNVIPPGGEALVENIPGIRAGSAWSQMAVSSVFPNAGAGFVAIAIFLFAFTTLMAYYYIAETAMIFLDRKIKYPLLTLLLKFIFLLTMFFGSIESVDLMWGFGDIGFGSMSYLNLVGIILLSKPLYRTFKDYERQKREGKDPIFNPDIAGVKNADLWREISKKYEEGNTYNGGSKPHTIADRLEDRYKHEAPIRRKPLPSDL